MGCRCCKMIQSYIFDPEAPPSPGCINEVNSYKHNEQGSNKFKENNENQEQKNEHQEDELNSIENKNQVNSRKEILWNHDGNDFQEDKLMKCVAKLDVAVNGGNSCTGAHPTLSPSTNPGKEASEEGPASQSETSSASRRDFYTRSNGFGQELDLAAGRQRKAACNEPNSIQDGNSCSAKENVFLKGSAALETQNNAIQLPDIDYPQNGNQTRNYVERYNFSVHCAHSDQNTGPSAIQDQNFCVTPPFPIKKSSIEPSTADSRSLSEGTPRGITTVAVTKGAQTPTRPSQKDTSGEMEEEDAEVAAALAALEAATAGEDMEEDSEYQMKVSF
ncbi:PDCD10 and GCKIII kinases-associated protein 1 [Phaethornis superciliosus]